MADLGAKQLVGCFQASRRAAHKGGRILPFREEPQEIRGSDPARGSADVHAIPIAIWGSRSHHTQSPGGRYTSARLRRRSVAARRR